MKWHVTFFSDGRCYVTGRNLILKTGTFFCCALYIILGARRRLLSGRSKQKRTAISWEFFNAVDLLTTQWRHRLWRLETLRFAHPVYLYVSLSSSETAIISLNVIKTLDFVMETHCGSCEVGFGFCVSAEWCFKNLVLVSQKTQHICVVKFRQAYKWSGNLRLFVLRAIETFLAKCLVLLEKGGTWDYLNGLTFRNLASYI